MNLNWKVLPANKKGQGVGSDYSLPSCNDAKG